MAAATGAAGRWAIPGLALGLALVAIAATADARGRALSSPVRDQLDSLRREKQARTGAQRKLDSRLLYATRMRRGERPADRITTLRPGIAVDPSDRVEVDLRCRVSPALLARIEEVGGEVVGAFPRFGAVRAWLPMAALEVLAGRDDIDGVRPADRAITHMVDTSEGDVAHRADAARTLFGHDGTGITIGVISDGADSVAARQATGDLPPSVTILAGQAGGGDEGTAMLEIVHDLAPGADLLFATGFGSQALMATNILALRAAGADIIVDDVAYFAEAVFQDDDIANAVDTVAADGALYFSSAGNSGNANDGTSGVWEGDFALGGLVNGDEAHDFAGDVSVVITTDSPFGFSLHWSDEDGASANDYDLLLTDAALTTVIAASTTIQDGTGVPFEFIDSAMVDDTGLRLVVVRDVGTADRVIHLNANRGRLAVATAGQTSGHSAARGAVSVAAVDARFPGGAGGVFDGSESVESYSSDGPRRVFYEADGTAITPGDFSSTGGELRSKPDVTAADCVETATPPFDPFCGTSAAAPHAAAIAALLLDLGGSELTPAIALQALTSTALDIEAVGDDFDSGAGILDALAAATLVDAPDCGDGLDNDADGAADFPADLGCDDATDISERAPQLPCDDGIDNDSDGWTDFPEDPGCGTATWSREDPQCQDGIDNDGKTGTDFDGGVSILGAGNGDPDGPDPQCANGAAAIREAGNPPPSNGGCGLGGGGLLLPLLGLLAPRRRAKRR